MDTLILLSATVLFATGWIWSVVLGGRVSILWGGLNLVFVPVSTILFAIKYKTAYVPILLMILGVTAYIGYGFYIKG
jgi:hypothetical protein